MKRRHIFGDRGCEYRARKRCDVFVLISDVVEFLQGVSTKHELKKVGQKGKLTVQLVLEALDQWLDSPSCLPCPVTCVFLYRRVPIDLALGRGEMHVLTFPVFPIQHLRAIKGG